MSGGKIGHLSRAKSAFIEYIFKPATLAGAVLLMPYMAWASPVKSQVLIDFLKCGDDAAREQWGDLGFFTRAKLSIFLNVFASFLEADNAYLVFFDRLARKYAIKRGWCHDEKEDKGEKNARAAPAQGEEGAAGKKGECQPFYRTAPIYYAPRATGKNSS